MSEAHGARPRVAVSACLLGQAVRYDGRHAQWPWLVEVLGAHVDWLPLCPEVGVGLGVPRPPIHLRQDADGDVALVGVSDGTDHTAAMRTWAGAQWAPATPTVHGWVLKARSPSCGVGDAVLQDPAGAVVGRRDGLFAALAAAHATAPIVSEVHLADPAQRRGFLQAVFRAVGRRVPDVLGEEAPGLRLDP